MRVLSRLIPAASAATALVLAATTAPVMAAPVAPYQMPFPCGETWSGATRKGHSPSVKAIDWNRNPDEGRPVIAAAPGVVTTAYATSKGGYGRWVVVDHGNGESTLYAHLAAVTVAVGQRVDQGMLLGTVGNTGNSRGAHLHFEQKQGKSVVDSWFNGVRFKQGALASRNCVDVPLAGNFTGDAAAEVAVFRREKKAKFLINQGALTVKFGKPFDEPFVGDWDGDGQLDVGVRTPARGMFKLRTTAGVVKIKFGRSSDLAIAGDWDGDGRTDVGVRRSSDGTFWPRMPDGSAHPVWLGDSDDLPVTGDWDGDGRTDLGVFDQATATFTLRTVGADGRVFLTVRQFGAAGDLPVVADWDGDGSTDLGVWSPTTAVLTQAVSEPVVNARSVAIPRRTLKVGRPRR